MDAPDRHSGRTNERTNEQTDGRTETRLFVRPFVFAQTHASRNIVTCIQGGPDKVSH